MLFYKGGGYWWNSVTSKKYGYIWSNVSPNAVHNLLANYSFNDRPIHYLEAKEGVDEKGSLGGRLPKRRRLSESLGALQEHWSQARRREDTPLVMTV